MHEELSGGTRWLTKAEAGAQLGVSERTIETWIEQRKLSSRPLPRPGKRPATVVDPADVERIAAEQHRGAVLTAPHASQLASSQDLQQPAIGPSPQQIAQLFAAAIGRAHTEPKPFMTLAQAEDFSGLPAGLLRKLIRAGRLPAERYSSELYVRAVDVEHVQLDSIAMEPAITPSVSEWDESRRSRKPSPSKPSKRKRSR